MEITSLMIINGHCRVSLNIFAYCLSVSGIDLTVSRMGDSKDMIDEYGG